MPTETSSRPSSRTSRELRRAYASGELSPVEVAEDVLDVIAEREPEINALAHHDPVDVRAQAEASSRRWRDGLPLSILDGVPGTIKENLSREGVRYRSGTAAVPGVISAENAPAVARLHEAGAVIVGSTAMPDWGMLSSGVSSANGITRSPWNPAWTVGGSSSGAGAAAAAGYGAFHLGTDIGGSIRFPATWLGLVGLKPSDGRVPHDNPYFGRAVGPLGRTVADVAETMGVIVGPDDRDYSSLPPSTLAWDHLDRDVRGLKVGLQLDAGAGLAVDREVATAVRAVADLLSDSGAEIVEVAPLLTPELLDAVDTFWRVRSWNDYLALDDHARSLVLPYIATWAEGGSAVAGHAVVAAYQRMQQIRGIAIRASIGLSAVVSPVAPGAAFPAEWPMPWGHDDQGMAHIAFTVPYNMSGQPAISINAGFTEDGRPIGVQFATRRFDDIGALQWAAWYEAHRQAAAAPVFPIR